MKLSSREFIQETFKLWIACLIEILLYLPIWILFKVYILPESVDPLWILVLPVLTLVGIVLRNQLTIRWKQLLCSLLLGSMLGFLAGGLSLSAIYLAIVGCTCSFLGITAVSRQNQFRIYELGIAVYFIAAVSFHRIPQLQDSSPFITIAGSVCLVLTLLMRNRNYLQYSSFSGETSPLPQGLRKYNKLFVFIFVIVAVLLAAGIGQILGWWIWRMLRTLLNWIGQLFSGSSTPPTQEEEATPVAPEMPTAGSTHPGLLALIVNYSLYILGIAIIGAIIYFALRWLYRNTSGIWHKAIDALLSMLRREQLPHNISAYVDEEKSVFTWEKTVQGIKDFWRSKLTSGSRRDLWENMNGSKEQVRWLYRHWLSSKRDSGYEAKNYLTPKETGTDIMKWASSRIRESRGQKGTSTEPDMLLDLYDKTRYGEKEPSSTEVAALKEQLKL